MSKENNIENIFRNALKTYSERPSSNVWRGIAPKLSGARLELMYKTAFKGFTSAPSRAVWRKIASNMWIKNFVHFNPLSFNVYYMAALSIIGVTSFIAFNNYTSFGTFNQDIVAEKHSQYDIEQLYNNEDINSHVIIPERTPVSLNVNQTESSYDAIELRDNNLVASKEDKSSENILANTVVGEESVDSKAIGVELAQQKIEEDALETVKRLKAPLVFHNLSYSPTLMETLEGYFVNVNYKDQSIYDTLGIDYKGDEIIIKRDYYELSAYFGVGKSSYDIVNLNSELQSEYENYSNNITPENSYYAGLNFAYNYKNIHFETGLQYIRHEEAGLAEIMKKEGIETYSYDYFENSFWQVDTVAWILDLDEYLSGNLVYIPYTDSSYITQTDSVQVVQVDSVDVLADVNYYNQYHIIGVPVIFGYEFEFGKFSVTPKSGVIAGFMIKRSGEYYNIEQNSVLSANRAPNSGILLDAYGAISIKYNVYNNISIFAEPNFRGSVISVYDKSYAINQRAYRFGLNAGVSIHF